MSNPLFKILKPGETDINSTDVWRYSIHSDHTNIKIKYVVDSAFQMNAGNFSATYSFAHGLGYIPRVFSWIERNGKAYKCNSFLGIDDVKFGSGPYDIISLFSSCSSDSSTSSISVYSMFPVDAPAYTNYTFVAHMRIAVDET